MSKRNAVKKSRTGRREKTEQQAIVWNALTFTGQLPVPLTSAAMA